MFMSLNNLSEVGQMERKIALHLFSVVGGFEKVSAELDEGVFANRPSESQAAFLDRLKKSSESQRYVASASSLDRLSPDGSSTPVTPQQTGATDMESPFYLIVLFLLRVTFVDVPRPPFETIFEAVRSKSFCSLQLRNGGIILFQEISLWLQASRDVWRALRSLSFKT